VILNGKLDSNNNVDTLTALVHVGHTKIKTFSEIRAKYNSSFYRTSSCSDLKKISRVSDCLPRKRSGKNTKAQDKFGSASDGNKFRVPASNPDGKDRLQKTKETTPDIKFSPKRRQ
jgi:hypothetical protein